MSENTVKLEGSQKLYAEELAERQRIDAEEFELKQEVLTLGPQGPISKAAREWLQRNAPAVLSEAESAPDLVTPAEIAARVQKLLELRAAGREKAAALKRERQAQFRSEWNKAKDGDSREKKIEQRIEWFPALEVCNRIAIGRRGKAPGALSSLFMLLASSPPIYCAVPFYGDPGQLRRPLEGQKLYLVTGRQVRFPGAYVSWPSASAQYSDVSNATLKGYKSWSTLGAAWFASCARGEHEHPSKGDAHTVSSTTPRQPTPPTIPVTPPPSPRPTAPTLLESSSKCAPSPASGRSHRHKGRPTADPRPIITSTSEVHAAPMPRSSSHISGKMAYAVVVAKNGEGGVVFDDYASARDHYHRLQASGVRPSLASTPSLTEGVCFVEGVPVAAAVSPVARARQVWIQEERAARTQNLSSAWEQGVDGWREVWTIPSDDETDEESSVTTGSS
ncbi:hypothetical protein B0H17DRAFT_1138884 [Mycena rosella]|uniref:Uncharacterized protein n=1 Tax=Mycena rosella TaxID=1033263 RepID=A0AAD7D5N9_MYCRO|nr:hypothetical protein B0H17DRAFT_1138884 [Mycena rosella]